MGAESKQRRIDYRALQHWHERNKLMQIEQEMQKQFQKQSALTDVLAQTVLRLVSEGNYDDAIRELDQYCGHRPGFPAFGDRSKRFHDYAKQLITVIQTKRNTPGLATSSKAKQQNVQDQILAHYDDLKNTLKHIRKVELDMKAEDMRSTVWIVKAAAVCLFALVGFTMFSEFYYGFGDHAVTAVEEFLDEGLDYLLKQAGL